MLDAAESVSPYRGLEATQRHLAPLNLGLLGARNCAIQPVRTVPKHPSPGDDGVYKHGGGLLLIVPRALARSTPCSCRWPLRRQSTSGILSLAFACASSFAPVARISAALPPGVVEVFVRVEDLRDLPITLLGGGQALRMIQRIDRERLAGLRAGNQVVEVAIVVCGPDLLDDPLFRSPGSSLRVISMELDGSGGPLPFWSPRWAIAKLGPSLLLGFHPRERPLTPSSLRY